MADMRLQYPVLVEEASLVSRAMIKVTNQTPSDVVKRADSQIHGDTTQCHIYSHNPQVPALLLQIVDESVGRFCGAAGRWTDPTGSFHAGPAS